MKRWVLAIPILLLPFGLSPVPALAGDPTAVEFVAGSYHGFMLSTVTEQSNVFSFDLNEIHNRQLDGTLMATGMDIPFHVTIGDPGIFTLVGHGGSFVAHGMIERQFGDGSLIAMADYRLVSDHGRLLLLKSIPTAHPARLAATYTGTFTRNDGVRGTLIIVVKQESSSFLGTATFGDPAAGGITLPYLATVGADPVCPTCTPIHVISLTAFADLTADAALNPDGGITGSVRVMFADGTSNTATFNLLPAVQNIT